MFRDGFYSAGKGLEAFGFGVEGRKNGGKFDAKLSLRECRKLWLQFGSQNGNKFNSHKFSRAERADKFELKFES